MQEQKMKNGNTFMANINFFSFGRDFDNFRSEKSEDMALCGNNPRSLFFQIPTFETHISHN